MLEPFEFEDTPEQKQQALRLLELWRKETTIRQVIADAAGVAVEDLHKYGGLPEEQ